MTRSQKYLGLGFAAGVAWLILRLVTWGMGKA
jgi:hypothetical protein